MMALRTIGLIAVGVLRVDDPEYRPPGRPYRNAGPMFSIKRDSYDEFDAGAAWIWEPGDEPDPFPPPRKATKSR